MFKRLKNWFKDKYLEWKTDQLIDSGTGVGNIESLNPFNTGKTDIYSDAGYHQDENQKKYQEAVLKLKRKINEKVGQKNAENYEKVLGAYKSDTDDWKKDLNNVDLLDLTNEDEMSVAKEFMKQAVVYKDADIKNEKQKLEMIDKRIKHYEILRVKKQIRKLNRELRKAERSGDEERSKELWGEINELRRSIEGTKKDQHSLFGC